MERPASTTYQPELIGQAGRDECAVSGSRCTSCGRGAAPPTPRCPWCGSRSEAVSFAPRGRIWSSSVIHIDVGTRKPPYGVAYVDLDDGPRVLTLLGRPARLSNGTRVELRPTADSAAWAEAHEAAHPAAQEASR